MNKDEKEKKINMIQMSPEWNREMDISGAKCPGKKTELTEYLTYEHMGKSDRFMTLLIKILTIAM